MARTAHAVAAGAVPGQIALDPSCSESPAKLLTPYSIAQLRQPKARDGVWQLEPLPQLQSLGLWGAMLALVPVGLTWIQRQILPTDWQSIHRTDRVTAGSGTTRETDRGPVALCLSGR